MAPEHPLYSRSVIIHFQYPTISGAQTLESIFWPLKPGPRPCCNRTVRTGDFPCWMHTFWSLVLQQEDQQKHLAAEGFYFYTSIQVKIFKYPNSPQRISLHLVLDLLVKIYLKKKKRGKKNIKHHHPTQYQSDQGLPGDTSVKTGSLQLGYPSDFHPPPKKPSQKTRDLTAFSRIHAEKTNPTATTALIQTLEIALIFFT